MTNQDVANVRAEALFVSKIQRSDAVTSHEVRRTVRETVRQYGVTGVAERVAEEFGEHPDTAQSRMCWCLGTVRSAYAA